MEELKPDYVDDIMIEPDYIMYRIDKGGSRHYVRIYKDGMTILAPSFHTLLKEAPQGIGLQEWFKNLPPEQIEFESENSKNYGTWFHIACGRILQKETFLLRPNLINKDIEEFCINTGCNYGELIRWIKVKNRHPRKDLIGFTLFCQIHKVKPIAIEFPVMEKHGLVATVIDIVCEMEYKKKKITAIIDLKSGANFWPDHELQLYVNKRLWEQEIDIPIDKLFNYGVNDFRMRTFVKYINGGKAGNFCPWRLKDQTDSKDIWKVKKYLSLYHGNPDNLKGVGESLDFNENFELNIDSDIKKSVEYINQLEGLTNLK